MRGSIGGHFGRLAAIAALLLTAIFLLGCGSEGDDDTGTTEGGSDDAFAPQVVTDDDIDAQEEDSPGRALLEWWQAFQFQDADGVLLLTSPKTIDELGENSLTELVKTRGQGLQGIEVLDATESGDSASVRAGLLTFTPEEEGGPPPDEPTASRPVTFAMVKEDDAWLFDEPAFLEPMIEGLKAAEEAAEEGSGGQGDDSSGQSDDSGGSN